VSEPELRRLIALSAIDGQVIDVTNPLEPIPDLWDRIDAGAIDAESGRAWPLTAD
jgi:hypothetical protein